MIEQVMVKPPEGIRGAVYRVQCDCCRRIESVMGDLYSESEAEIGLTEQGWRFAREVYIEATVLGFRRNSRRRPICPICVADSKETEK